MAKLNYLDVTLYGRQQWPTWYLPQYLCQGTLQSVLNGKIPITVLVAYLDGLEMAIFLYKT